MKKTTLWLALLLAGLPLHGTLAVDSMTSRDAPDLASVRAKIKARDFAGALAELRPMLQTHQHADVYNLMGFSLRKTGDQKQAFTFYRKGSISTRSTRARSNISASFTSRPVRSTRRASISHG